MDKFYRSALTLLMLVLSAAMYASDGYKTMRIHLNNGRTVGVVLSDDTSANFLGKQLMISGGGKLVTVNRADIHSFIFSSSSALDQVESNTSDILEAALENGILNLSALPQGAVVSVYSLSGKLLQQVKASGGSFDLRSIGEHAVILNVDGVSLKLSIN